MYYSSIGLLAAIVLLIENHEILLFRNKAFEAPSWRVYRRFLNAILVYYATDVVWGILESHKLAQLLFVDTTIYFGAMAEGVMLWAQYTVAYVEEDSAFGRALVTAGRVLAGGITLIAAVNIFVPVLFTVDANCVYHALPLRYALLICQILLLLLISAHALSFVVHKRGSSKTRGRYRALVLFSAIMAVFLFFQLLFPYLPIYSVAYLLGTCLLRTFVIEDEKEAYQHELDEAKKIKEMMRIQDENATARAAYEKALSASTMYTHFAQTLAHDYTDLYYVNLDTESYVEYRTDDKGNALTEVRRGGRFFDECQVDAEVYVHPDDRETFKRAMTRGALLGALRHNNAFTLTYRLLENGDAPYVSMKVSRMEDKSRFIIIGVTDVDEQVKQQRAAERMREEHIAYARLNALSGDFLCVYVVVPETGRYREYSVSDEFAAYALPKEGMDFFESARAWGREPVCPDDRERFLSLFTKEGVLWEIEHNEIFVLTVRLDLADRDQATFVQIKVAIVDESEGPRLVVGMSDIDSAVRQEEEYERRLAQARSKANIDALTGVKNKHAYVEAEERLNRQIEEHSCPEFAIAILDVNGLKTINDTVGHQAGDQYLREACAIVCDMFKHSPVFRVGGDEFAVILQGHDYAHRDELAAAVDAHNEDAVRNGGIVIACGMAAYDGDATVAAVFDRADRRMYDNKTRLKSHESGGQVV